MIARLFAYLKTMRLIICLFAAIMALEGYWLAVHRFEVFSLAPLFAAIAAGSGLAFANVLNDILDLEADRINHPHRSLPSGKITPAEASWLAGALCAVSLLSSFLAGGQMFLLAVGLLALSVVYNVWAKKIPVNLFKQLQKRLDEMRKCKKDAEEDDGEEDKATKAKLAHYSKGLGWALKSESAPRINAMLGLTRSEPGIPIR